MKKYIRTKDDNIYCTDDLEKNEILNRKPFVHRKTKELIYPTYIKREADTIEELCDEFVCGKNHLLLKLYELKSEDFKEDVKDVVYGAIWTDEGLIYVAKMNRKGEFIL